MPAIQELAGLEDAEGSELDDMTHMLGDLLVGTVDSDVDDEEDDDDEDDDELSREAAAENKRRRLDARLAKAQNACIERMLEQKAREKRLGFTYPVALRTIPIEPFSEHGWLTDERLAMAVYSDDYAADERIVSQTDCGGQYDHPPAGAGRKYEMPESIASIRFEPYMLTAVPEIVTTNTVATCHIGQLADLYRLVERVVATSFDPKRFAALLYRVRDGTILLFPSGSAVCTGPRGPALSLAKCQQFVLRLVQLGVRASFQCYRLQNVVSNGSAGFDLDLKRLAEAYPLNAQFDPLKFPGLIFRIDSGGRSVGIFFKSGRTILTGFRTQTETRLMWTWLHANVLRQFKACDQASNVSQREYRLMVTDDHFIDLTVDNIALVQSRRAQYDVHMTSATGGDARVKSEPPDSLMAAAELERRQTLFDVLGRALDVGSEAATSSAIDELLERDVIALDDDEVPDAAYVRRIAGFDDVRPPDDDKKMDASMPDSVKMAAWLTNNAHLINAQ